MKAHSTIIAFAILFLLPIAKMWGQSTFEVDGITYRVIKEADEASTFGTVAVTTGNYTGIVAIPNAVRVGEEQFADVYKVVAIDECAFDDCAALEEVTVPVSIETIGNFAFRGCLSLTKVDFPTKSNISTLGHFIFMSSGLKSIALPDGITFLPNGTFYGCKELSEVHLPKSLTKIDMNAFSGCSSLKSILLPDNLKSIGIAAFLQSGLEEIRIPENVVVISNSLFQGCTSLKHVELSGKTIRIGDGAFAYCRVLSEINKPETLKAISPSAFERSEMIPEYYRQ